MNDARLYLRYLSISVQSQLQYRVSFILMSVGHFFVTATEIFAIWVLFARFKNLGGWQLEEVALFYGIINVAFAIAESVGRGFDDFPNLVRTGEFDRMLARPRSTVLQVAAREIHLMRIGRLSQGLLVLFWASGALQVDWTMAKGALMGFAIFGGMCLFIGLFVLQATMAFWTVESLELMNMVTYGGTEAAQYPIPIYRPWFQKLFIFVIPLACVTYYPALAILEREDGMSQTDPIFHWIAPAVGVLFLAVSLRIWEFGVRHYRSTGS